MGGGASSTQWQLAQPFETSKHSALVVAVMPASARWHGLLGGPAWRTIMADGVAATAALTGAPRVEIGATAVGVRKIELVFLTEEKALLAIAERGLARRGVEVTPRLEAETWGVLLRLALVHMRGEGARAPW